MCSKKASFKPDNEGTFIMIKKQLIALLLALLLLPAAAMGENFYAGDITEARKKALNVFKAVAFSSEDHNNGRDYLVRWNTPIRIYATGDATARDLKTLDDFIMNLGLRVPCMPPVYRVGSRQNADIVIAFCPLSDMKKWVTDYTEGNWGYFYFSWNNSYIYKAEIAIASDVTDQQSRNHLIQEELFGAMGLANDHWEYSDSIVYQGWTTVQQPSEMDWLMMNYLYSPLVKAGQKWPEVQRAIRDFYGL